MLFTQKQDCFIGFGVFLFLKPSAEKHPATNIKYMPADVNCISSYNKHESDHSVWPFVENLEHQRTSGKKRYRTKPHWKLSLDWKNQQFCTVSHSNRMLLLPLSPLSCSLKLAFTHFHTKSSLSSLIYDLSWTVVQNRDGAVQFQSLTTYTSTFRYTPNIFGNMQFYSEVYFFFDAIPLMDRFVLFPLETLLIEQHYISHIF